jgi:UDP-glucose 4-epimerase
VDFSNPNEDSLRTALKNVDAIVHLAALNDSQCRENSELAHRINVDGTRSLLKAASDANVQQFIYVSTAHVYGSPLAGTFNEDSETKPSTDYALTHRLAEDCVRDSDLPQKLVFRITNGIGAPTAVDTDCWMLLVNDLCKQAVTTGRIVLKTHGLQLRNFVSLSSVEKAIREQLGSKAEWQLINIVGITKSIREMAQDIKIKASQVLNKEILLECPEPTLAEQEQAKSSSLEIQTRWPSFSPQTERMALNRAIEETLLFCVQRFSTK